MRLLEMDAELRDSVLQRNPTLVDVTPAARWYWEESPETDWNYTSFPVLSLPGVTTYMEYEMPQYINENGKLIRTQEMAGALWACLAICVEIPEDDRHLITNFAPLTRFLYKSFGWPAPSEKEADIAMVALPRFALVGMMYLRGNGLPTKEIGAFGVFLDEDGKVTGDDDACATILTPLKPDAENFIGEVGALSFPFLFAISLMNCKNVELVDDERHLKRGERRRMERNGIPVIDFRQLHIKSMQRRVSEDMGNSRSGVTNRLHFVRAHWATYTADAPLFGKYQGTFFRPQHARGNLEAGAVLKTYTVDAP